MKLTPPALPTLSTISFCALSVTFSPALRTRSSRLAPSACTAVQQSCFAVRTRTRPWTPPAAGAALGVGVGGGYTRSGGNELGGGRTAEGCAPAAAGTGREVFQARNPTPARSSSPATTSTGRASERRRFGTADFGTAGSAP